MEWLDDLDDLNWRVGNMIGLLSSWSWDTASPIYLAVIQLDRNTFSCLWIHLCMYIYIYIYKCRIFPRFDSIGDLNKVTHPDRTRMFFLYIYNNCCCQEDKSPEHFWLSAFCCVHIQIGCSGLQEYIYKSYLLPTWWHFPTRYAHIMISDSVFCAGKR